MKKILFLVILAAFFLVGCGGTYGSTDFTEVVEIPESGIIESAKIKELKDSGDVATFAGKSGDYSYEWTIFGSDITEVQDVDLGVKISAASEDGEDNAYNLTFEKETAVPFPALLSIHEKEQLDVDNAVLTKDGEVVATISVTGSRETIYNIAGMDLQGSYVIVSEVKDEETSETSEAKAEDADGKDADKETTKKSSDKKYSAGNDTETDKYLTDPVPAGKPMPVEPEDAEIDTSKKHKCTFSIECSSILNNLDQLNTEKIEMVPSNGVILAKTTVEFSEGESVFDVLQRVCKGYGIHLEAEWTPLYNSAYIEGIHNLYEFDCGDLSGWMYRVNGWYPNYGCSRYQLSAGDVVEWRYTCDLGRDIGGGDFME